MLMGRGGTSVPKAGSREQNWEPADWAWGPADALSVQLSSSGEARGAQPKPGLRTARVGRTPGKVS